MDAEGRYCLNDLHCAACGEKRHGPSYWLAAQHTKELIAELVGTGNPVGPITGAASANSQTPIKTLNDGRNNGTYVAKELVYAYAMWISATFYLKVIRAYDALVAPPAPPQFQILRTLSEAVRIATQ